MNRLRPLQRLKTFINRLTLKKLMAFGLSHLLLLHGLFFLGGFSTIQAQTVNSSRPNTSQSFGLNEPRLPVRGEISIMREINLANRDDKISLNLRDVSIRDVLNLIAQQGNFNVILDESVEGTISVDVTNVSINKALEYIFMVGDLSYTKDGNTLLVAAQREASRRNFNAKTFKTIPVLYKSVDLVASQLNQTLFSVLPPGASNRAIAASDPDSNSLLIMGTDSDIKLVQQALKELDVPRNRKVYYIKYNSPSNVAQVLAANLFGLGAPAPTAVGGAGGAGGPPAAGGASSGGASGGATASSSSSGSSGASSSSSGTGSSSGSSGSGGASTGTGTAVIVNSGGVTFIAEPISSTLTILGTDEQIALVDSIIKEVDIRRPQVSLEVALVEVQNTNTRSLIPAFNDITLGSYRLSLLDGGLTSSLFWKGGPLIPKKLSISKESGSSNPRADRPYSTTGQNNDLRGRLLANPTVVALDGTTSTIQITDEIPTINTTTTVTNGLSIITSTISKETAGIILTLTPRVTNDGSVTLTLRPEVSQPLREVRVVSGGNVNSTFLLSRRTLDIASARVRDGQTLVIGGLLRESSSEDIRKIPGLSDLPIVGAMLRSTNSASKQRTELVLMVTPHILKEDAVTYFTQPEGLAVQGPYSNMNQGAVQPVALPRNLEQQSTTSENNNKKQASSSSETKSSFTMMQTLEEVTQGMPPKQGLSQDKVIHKVPRNLDEGMKLFPSQEKSKQEKAKQEKSHFRFKIPHLNRLIPQKTSSPNLSGGDSSLPTPLPENLQ